MKMNAPIKIEMKVYAIEEVLGHASSCHYVTSFGPILLEQH